MNERERRAQRYDAGNVFLDALPVAERDALAAELVVVDLDAPESIFAREGAIEHVYFPIDSMFSITASLHHGGGTVEVYEVGVVGRDGIVGAEVALGAATSHRFVLTQVAGRAARLPAEIFVCRAKSSEVLTEAIHRYLLWRIYAAEQLVGCAFAHTLEQRCARWILTVRDLVGNSEFGLRREFLAMMLAIEPSGVDGALGALLATETIRYEEQAVTILRPGRLREASCECYDALRHAHR